VGFLSGLGLIGSAAAAAAMAFPSPIGPEDEAARQHGEPGGRLGAGGGVGGWIADKANRVKAALGMGSPAAPSGQAGANARESVAFWKSKGMTDDAAKMMAANEMRETNFNPGAVGGAGEVGSFQWDASRRARIKAALGIDVANASHADQLKAAEWELKTHFPDVWAKMQDPNTSDAERAVNLVHNYEKSGNQPADVQKNLANMKAIGQLLAPGGNETNIPLSGGAAGRPDSLTGMQPEFRARLAAMMKDAPPGTSVFSGYRSQGLQDMLFAKSNRSGHTVARHSHHTAGDAADLHFSSPAANKWFHDHAAEYGLRFPMSYENWHIQSDPNTRVAMPEIKHALHQMVWANNLSNLNTANLFGSPASAAPLGHQTHHSIRYGNHAALNQKTNITVNAAGDAGATAKAVAGFQNNVNSDAIRNLQGSAQ
jgi:Phage tail lysozyme